jgi:hypothetical protein
MIQNGAVTKVFTVLEQVRDQSIKIRCDSSQLKPMVVVKDLKSVIQEKLERLEMSQE